MRARAGDVVGARTRSAIGHTERFKHHLCVHEGERHFLFVNSRQYPDDFPLSAAECPGLDLDVSYVSVSRVLHVAHFPRDAVLTCAVPDAYLLALFEHARVSRVISEVDRRKVLTGIAAKLNEGEEPPF